MESDLTGTKWTARFIQACAKVCVPKWLILFSGALTAIAGFSIGTVMSEVLTVTTKFFSFFTGIIGAFFIVYALPLSVLRMCWRYNLSDWYSMMMEGLTFVLACTVGIIASERCASGLFVTVVLFLAAVGLWYFHNELLKIISQTIEEEEALIFRGHTRIHNHLSSHHIEDASVKDAVSSYTQESNNLKCMNNAYCRTKNNPDEISSRLNVNNEHVSQPVTENKLNLTKPETIKCITTSSKLYNERCSENHVCRPVRIENEGNTASRQMQHANLQLTPEKPPRPLPRKSPISSSCSLESENIKRKALLQEASNTASFQTQPSQSSNTSVSEKHLPPLPVPRLHIRDSVPVLGKSHSCQTTRLSVPRHFLLLQDRSCGRSRSAYNFPSETPRRFPPVLPYTSRRVPHPFPAQRTRFSSQTSEEYCPPRRLPPPPGRKGDTL